MIYFARLLSVPWVSCVFTAVCLMGHADAQVGSPFVDYAQMREQLIEEVLKPGGVTDERVISAIRNTARHEFVPLELRSQAYYDRALPIGSRQTISSPFIVAMMTQELKTEPELKVLEIGTGSGFQAAILSPLVKEVYSIEIVPELGRQARKVLDKLGYKNVFTKIGDGFKGWEEHAPFDRIIVTCSPEDVPQPLVDQLAEGGLMVIPVGERYQQTLTLMRKRGDELEREALRPTLFVPMTGAAEDQRDVQPDPAKPKLLNGGFEEEPPENGFMPGWFYQRQLQWEKHAGDELVADLGEHFIKFTNDSTGRPANLLQGVALDGRSVPRVNLSAVVKMENVQPGLFRDEIPTVAIRFYDEDRQLVGTSFLGPFRGTRDWKTESRMFRVPGDARFAIVSIGLFGATGAISYDNIVLEAATR